MPPAVAVMIDEVLVGEGEVDTVKVTVALPAGTVTVAGTVARVGLELVSVTTTPPAGAAPVSRIAPVELAPPITVDGLSVSDCSAGAGGGAGETVIAAVLLAPFSDAVRPTAVVAVTAEVVMGNEAEAPPAATDTDAGTAATEGFALASAT